MKTILLSEKTHDYITGEKYLDELGRVRFSSGASDQGSIYKNRLAFENKEVDEVCYIPEYAFNDFDLNSDEDMSLIGYTYSAILEECNGQDEIATNIFLSIDWQHPSTLLNEEVCSGDIMECTNCGKLYYTDDSKECPHCQTS